MSITSLLRLLFLLLLAYGPPAVAQSRPDSSFSNDGIAMVDTGTCVRILVQPDGKILAAGPIKKTSGWIPVMRFLANGQPDLSFGSNGFATGLSFSGIYAACLQPDGKILLGGTVSNGPTSYDFLLIRLTAGGQPDMSFGNGGVVKTAFITSSNDKLRSIAVQPDGRIIALGNADEDMALARYLPDGSPDSTFGINGKVVTVIGSYGGTVNNVALLPDGRIVAGAVSWIDALTGDAFVAVRYRQNGSLDTGFNHTGIAYTYLGGLTYCNALQVQPDGKVLLAGYADSAVLVRYDTAGRADWSFGQNGIARFAPGKIRALALMPDGRLLMGGTRNDQFALYRCNADGLPDLSFGTNGISLHQVAGHANELYALALQPDGKLLAGGEIQATATTASWFTLCRYQDVATAVLNPLPAPVMVYPNPADRWLMIRNLPAGAPAQAYLSAMDGRIVYRGGLNGNQSLQLPELPAGLYCLHIFQERHTLFKQFISIHH